MLDTPALPVAAHNRMVVAAFLTAPLGQAFCHTVKSDADRDPAIIHLPGSRNPNTVRRRIVAVDVHALDGEVVPVALGKRPLAEALVVLPLTAHVDSTVAVVSRLGKTGFTPFNHLCPYLEKTLLGITVRQARHTTLLCIEASTRLGPACVEVA